MAPDTRELTLAQISVPLTSKPGSKNMDLPKTTAFVSGANRGLGKHLADQFTSRGAGVHGGARKPGTLDTSTGVIPVQLDITDPASVTAAAAAAPDTTLEEEVS
jgi:NAD(P)-dependent dehydrogenase (short-subunit alcohol dehydrogenase family)